MIQRYIGRFIDTFTLKLGSAVSWLALAMVLLTLAIVLLRYGFQIGAIPLQELVMYMHGLLFLFGIPTGILKDTHVRVDIVYSRLSKRTQNLINAIGHFVFLIPVSVFILVTSLPYVSASWRVLEGSSEVGGLPAIFLLKTVIPIAAGLMLLQGFSELLKFWQDRRSA